MPEVYLTYVADVDNGQWRANSGMVLLSLAEKMQRIDES